VHQTREFAAVSERESVPAKDFDISRDKVSYLRGTGYAVPKR
jgi:hypothetical protein